MAHLKFDLAKLERLNDPGRLDTIPPDILWERLGHPEGARSIVEIGAGTGLFAAAFAQRAPEAVFWAVDTEDVMLEWVRAHRHEASEGRLIPVKATEAAVPLDDAIADAVYMINVHHELVDPGRTYAEAFRLLAPGGRLLVVDWARRETPKGPPLAVRVEPCVIVDLLADAGFENVTADEDTLAWHLIVTARRPASRRSSPS